MGGFDSFLASLRKKVEIKALIHPNGHKKCGIAVYLKPTMPPICMSSQSSEIRF